MFVFLNDTQHVFIAKLATRWNKENVLQATQKPAFGNAGRMAGIFWRLL